MHTSPTVLARNEIDTLLAHIGGVRDGEVEDVHQARVSTRRLRELLPLVTAETGAQTDAAADLLRRSGRLLGSVRELDTLVELSTRLADRNPPGAAVLAVCRAQLMSERQDVSRRLLKRLEQENVARLRRLVPSAPRAVRPWVHRAPGWHAALADRLETRAVQLRRTVERGGGIYMPNRLHRVRIALKKLRYAVEIAHATGHWRPQQLLRDTRRLQDRLGAIHDEELLLARLARMQMRDGLADQVAAVVTILRAGILTQYSRYRRRRDRLLGIASACQTHMHGEPRTWLAPGARLAAALVVPLGIAYLGRHESAGAGKSGHRTHGPTLTILEAAGEVRN